MEHTSSKNADEGAELDDCRVSSPVCTVLVKARGIRICRSVTARQERRRMNTLEYRINSILFPRTVFSCCEFMGTAGFALLSGY